MNVLGIRCSNSDYSFAILTGTKISPEIIIFRQTNYPKGFTKPHSVKWLYQEIETLVSDYSIKKIVMKASEAISAQKTLEDRIEHEAMIFLVAANHNIRDVSKKRKNTIASNLGLKGKSKYLAKLDTSILPNFDTCNDKIKEAILVAWSDLP